MSKGASHTHPARLIPFDPTTAAQSILVQDFVKNPTLRRNIRQLFRDKGLVTVLPTEKGLTKIDAFHPYFVGNARFHGVCGLSDSPLPPSVF